MTGLSNEIDFSALSDEDLEKLLAEEREKRKHMIPHRAQKTKASGEGGKTRGRPKGSGNKKPAQEIVEVEID